MTHAPASHATTTHSEIVDNVLTVCIGCGAQSIQHLELTPALPVAGAATAWTLRDIESSETIDMIEVGFEVKSSAIQQEFERAVIVITIADADPGAQGVWRFADHGVVPCQNSDEISEAIDTEITDFGETLVAYIHLNQDGKVRINFSFVATYTDNLSGVVTTYHSADPGVIVGRPLRP